MARLTGPAGWGLTPVQRTIIDYLAGHFRQHGRSPSLREIGLAAGLKSSSAVSYQVKALQAKGCLTYQPGLPRSITLTAPYQPQWPAPSPAAPPAGERDDDAARVPLVGRIAAGGPLLALEEVADELPLPRSLVGYGDLIALRVRGDSMTGAGIWDGDLVVVRRQEQVETGELAAALLKSEFSDDYEATVKEFRVYDGHAWLIAHNPAYRPIPADRARIIGKVRAVFRGNL
jgi:repressor LexA